MITALRVTLLFPFSVLFAGITEFRRLIYTKIFKPQKLNAFVVSVGNLTSGGTGKTPFVQELISTLIKSGVKVAVVSRSYRAAAKVPTQVSISADSAERFGDEPTLIAKKFPQVPVFVGPKKLETCHLVDTQVRPDIILVDDGFQHIRLHRDMDIVLIDVTEPRWHYLPLPAGYGRDALWQLDRAHAIVLSKDNLASESQRNFARALVSSHTQVMKMTYHSGEAVDLLSGASVTAAEWNDKKVLLVSAVGRPLTFETLIKAETSSIVVGHVIFKDHHPYTEQDVNKIISVATNMKAQYILTTEKDAVKLQALLKNAPAPIPWHSIPLSTKVTGLSNFVGQILQGRSKT